MYLSSWRVADRFLGQNGECDLNADCSRVENHGKRTFHQTSIAFPAAFRSVSHRVSGQPRWPDCRFSIS